MQIRACPPGEPLLRDVDAAGLGQHTRSGGATRIPHQGDLHVRGKDGIRRVGLGHASDGPAVVVAAWKGKDKKGTSRGLQALEDARVRAVGVGRGKLIRDCEIGDVPRRREKNGLDPVALCSLGMGLLHHLARQRLL